MKKATREWMRKAESDYRVAKEIASMKPMPTDEVCLHCQQAAEKFLKALLQELAVAFSKTHNLEALGKSLSLTMRPWCESVWEPGASLRVSRGGGWYSDSGLCRAAFRFRFTPVIRFNFLGFRLARVPLR
ncbi:MAG TPA: HEPN domain-containing protein [Pirellulales bacterium]|nr:HEPN domain-containing protein [Pirellulales bacterium]